MPGEELSGGVIPAVQWSSAILPILDDGQNLKIPIKGLSMYPLLVGGRDEVLITTVLGKKLKRGDIVLYVREDGTHVLHRIHHLKNKKYYMLGDAQTWIEGPIKEEDVLAVATSVIRKGKMISCSQYGYRIIAGLWLLMRPLRPQLLRIVRVLKRKMVSIYLKMTKVFTKHKM